MTPRLEAQEASSPAMVTRENPDQERIRERIRLAIDKMRAGLSVDDIIFHLENQMRVDAVAAVDAMDDGTLQGHIITVKTDFPVHYTFDERDD